VKDYQLKTTIQPANNIQENSMRQMFIAMLSCLFLGGVVQAREANIHQVPYQRLSEEISVDGESLEAFLLRVGPKLRAYSNETTFEACGAVASNGKQFGLVIGTSGSHMACGIFWSRVPEGMTNIGVGIHSHGISGQFRQNKADRWFMGIPEDSKRSGWDITFDQDLNMFSDTDKANGRGYLATETGVIYYNGKGIVSSLGDDQFGRASASSQIP
jgi:hypothetical protein